MEILPLMALYNFTVEARGKTGWKHFMSRDASHYLNSPSCSRLCLTKIIFFSFIKWIFSVTAGVDTSASRASPQYSFFLMRVSGSLAHWLNLSDVHSVHCIVPIIKSTFGFSKCNIWKCFFLLCGASLTGSKMATHREGCLSVPGFSAHVARPVNVYVTGYVPNTRSILF